MEPKVEIRRLSDLLPASARSSVKILSKAEQQKVIDVFLPLPWHRERLIYINFDLWRNLTKAQRDLLLLRTVSWLIEVRWFKPDIYQGVVLIGLFGGLIESAQGDAVGVVTSAGLSAIAILKILRNNRSQESEIAADLAAISLVQRRGYSEPQAAEHLLKAIEAVAKVEKRSTLSFIELIRTQNLRTIAGFLELVDS
ncbi:MAG: DUF3318 domain-containing protein [Richelia sp. RM2_1_2]|nr:DUF3318 domain-containing protein [Richelia sp. SM2_1_7]NJM20346.1 DUF3318 domain-containing protein [Richelia sp. SM1_7_0]NJN07816.1 DUF3318 domain-containing protein [Richelia sp. RM1_1_1]NJO31600.1 DUF3318 domain-containing protein [Richelia sp. SL_2_1]NJO58544.1 DUF3318 domain-containing protein [Richelia sp. RM2_1_2]